MTDIENIIINRIDKALEAAGYANILGSTYQDIPASFPWVFFEQSDAYESVTQHNSSRANNFETVTFEADIYSSKNSGAKGECKAICQIIDAEMQSLGFSRSTAVPMKPTSDMYDARLFVRYRANVDSNKYIYHI